MSSTARARFFIRDFQPAYSGMPPDEMRRRVEAGLRELAHCRACPRNRGINALEDETRVCNTGRLARVAKRLRFGQLAPAP